MEAEMKGEYVFLSDKSATYDLVMIQVVSSPRPQVLRAKLERIYSARKGIDFGCLGAEIEFIHSPANWGSVVLEVGEKAFLFVSLISGKLYEAPWHGHMVVEAVDGTMYAIFPSRELWLSEQVPEKIRVNSRQDPKRSYATMVRFDVMEAYLQSLIENEVLGV